MSDTLENTYASKGMDIPEYYLGRNFEFLGVECKEIRD
jgi:hypothetical protein